MITNMNVNGKELKDGEFGKLDNFSCLDPDSVTGLNLKIYPGDVSIITKDECKLITFLGYYVIDKCDYWKVKLKSNPNEEVIRKIKVKD